MSILLLTDSPFAGAVLGEVLNEAGWSVQVAGEIWAAKVSLKSGGVRVLLADKSDSMRKDSFAFASLAWAAWPKLSIIYMKNGATSAPGHILRPREWALSKPFTMATMLRTVRVALAV